MGAIGHSFGSLVDEVDTKARIDSTIPNKGGNITGTSLNDVSAVGFYNGEKLLDGPVELGDKWAYLVNQPYHASPNWMLQTLTAFQQSGKVGTWTRQKVNASWLPWVADLTGDVSSIKAALATKADKATTLAGYGITNSYTKSEEDTKFATKADKATTLAGYGITEKFIPTLTKDISNSDLNDLQDNGFFDGKGLKNAPANIGTTGWLHVQNQSHSLNGADWRVQFVTAFDPSAAQGSPPLTWCRVKSGGTWNPWTSDLTKTVADLTALVNTKANKATTLGGYGITDSYTKAQNDTSFAGKADKGSTLGAYGIGDAYTKQVVDNAFATVVHKAGDQMTGALSSTLRGPGGYGNQYTGDAPFRHEGGTNSGNTYVPLIRQYTDGDGGYGTTIHLGTIRYGGNRFGAAELLVTGDNGSQGHFKFGIGGDLTCTGVWAQTHKVLSVSDAIAHQEWDYDGVATLLRWKNFGSNHVIFDAGNGTSPTGTPVDRTTPSAPWGDAGGANPSLMGWNGSKTYGVRVDRSNYAETLEGLRASAFVRTGASIDVSGQDLNNLTSTGFYRGYGCLHGPNGWSGWWYFTVNAYDGASWCLQEAVSLGGTAAEGHPEPTKWMRRRENGAWSNWVVFEDQIATREGNYFWGNIDQGGIRFPNWLGSITIAWGMYNGYTMTAAGNEATIAWPTWFKSIGLVLTQATAPTGTGNAAGAVTAASYPANGSLGTGGIKVKLLTTPNEGVNIRYLIIGTT